MNAKVLLFAILGGLMIPGCVGHRHGGLATSGVPEAREHDISEHVTSVPPVKIKYEIP